MPLSHAGELAPHGVFGIRRTTTRFMRRVCGITQARRADAEPRGLFLWHLGLFLRAADIWIVQIVAYPL